MTSPTVYSDASTVQNSRTLTWSPSFVTGDVIVVTAETWDQADTLNLPTGTGVTFTQYAAPNAATRTRTYIWAGTATGSSSGSITATANSSSIHNGNLYVYALADGYSLAATPNVATGTSGGTVSLAGTSGNAYVVAEGDWNGNDGTSRTWAASGSEDLYQFSSGNSTQYAAHGTLTGANTTVGLTAPTTNTLYCVAAMEILFTAGGGSGPDANQFAHWQQIPPGNQSPAGRLNPWLGTGGDVASGTAWTDTENDTEGLSDSLVVDQFKVISDPENLTDALVVDQGKVLTDPAGLTDAIVTDQFKVITDSAGLTDSITVENGKLLTQSDAENLTDTVIVDQGKVISDPAGLTDSVVVDQAKVITDSAGLTDSILVENGKLVTQSDAENLTDTVALSQSKSVTDPAGLTDSVSLSQAKVVTDSAGLTDSIIVELISGGGGTAPDIRHPQAAIRPGSDASIRENPGDAVIREGSGATIRPNPYRASIRPGSSAGQE